MCVPPRSVVLRSIALFPRSRGLRGAYLRGWIASRAGRPREACPYGTGTRRQRTGWTRSWRAAWLLGWRDVSPSPPS